MDLELKGKKAVITGGSDGIGKATAQALAAEGADVIIAARTLAQLEEATAEITRSAIGEASYVQADVTDKTSVQIMMNKAADMLGGIDILVNNAGTSSASLFEDMTDEQVMEDLNLKVFGAIYCTRAAFPWLKRSTCGSIVNITTPGGKASPGGGQPTALSRAAGISLSKSWSKEFAAYNIRVNTICVGLFKSGQHRTRWQASNSTDPSYSLEDHWTKLSARVPLGRMGEAREAGDLIAFISSPRASYITGASINADGGVSPVV